MTLDRTRIPKVGDIITQKSDGKEHIGCVCEIVADRYGHEKVFIVWAETPIDYMPKYGYGAGNIYNMRKTFQVIKSP